MKEVFYEVQCFVISSLFESLRAQSDLSLSKNLPVRHGINVLLSLCSSCQDNPWLSKTPAREQSLTMPEWVGLEGS